MINIYFVIDFLLPIEALSILKIYKINLDKKSYFTILDGNRSSAEIFFAIGLISFLDCFIQPQIIFLMMALLYRYLFILDILNKNSKVLFYSICDHLKLRAINISSVVIFFLGI